MKLFRLKVKPAHIVLACFISLVVLSIMHVKVSAASNESGTYEIGDVWTVDGQWSLVIASVTETDYRVEYGDTDPEAVYIVDYYYCNNGFDSSNYNGMLYFDFEASSSPITDSAGDEGYFYYGGTYTYGIDEVPVGAYGKGQVYIGVDHSGTFTIHVSKIDDTCSTNYEADFVIDPELKTQDVSYPKPTVSQDKSSYKIGDEWTVDDQWSFVVANVTETKERNEYRDEDTGYVPDTVYIIDYYYCNNGYDSHITNLDFNLDPSTFVFVDKEGKAARQYSLDLRNYDSVPIGASGMGQISIEVDHPGTFTMYVNKDDDSYTNHSASFTIDPDKKSSKSISYPKSTAKNTDKKYNIGEEWTVDNNWSFMITNVEKSDDYSSLYYPDEDKDNSLYLVTYTYINNGFTYPDDDIWHDLRMNLTDAVAVDSKKIVGDIYLTDNRCKETPEGAVSSAQVLVSVKNSGPFELVYQVEDSGENKQKATFYVDPDSHTSKVSALKSTVELAPDALKTGDTWTVDDQWSLTVSKVSKASKKELSDYDPAAKNGYVVEYSYKNLGYGDDLMIECDCVIDSTQEITPWSSNTLYSDNNSKPEQIDTGETCKVKAIIPVTESGAFLLYFTIQDSNFTWQKQFFRIPVSTSTEEKSTVMSESTNSSINSTSSEEATNSITDYSAAQVGDIIEFGSYEQDNRTSNGKENIEWQVLAREEGRLLVISKYALDGQPYNTEDEDVTWETCTLRKWLNSTFLQEAFNSDEIKLIPTVTVTAEENPVYYAGSGKDTKDKIFLLKVSEVEQYLNSADQRICMPTVYADAKVVDINEEGSCEWLLRSRAFFQYENDCVFVNTDGKIAEYGYFVTFESYIRPAMWISIEENSDSETTLPELESDQNKNDTLTTENEISAIKTADVGDTVIFGSYEQDNDYSDGKEPIEWRVLDKKDGKILVISKYALDNQSYSVTVKTDASLFWENCDIRAWLNTVFLYDAFNSEEIGYIPTVTVTADLPEWSSDTQGNDTTDQIFLLSVTEAEQYFTSDTDRMCVPTQYTIENGCETSDKSKVDGKKTCLWWLRTRGNKEGQIFLSCRVDCNGDAVSKSRSVHADTIGVRPALWINTK